jgi:hypothetical protein
VGSIDDIGWLDKGDAMTSLAQSSGSQLESMRSTLWYPGAESAGDTC